MNVAPRLGLPAVIVALLFAGCGADDGALDLGTRAVVIGIDGADWKIIDALSAEGRMPNLSRLREQGVWGELETLNDIPLSPVIWTSVAT
ncbi:MAG: alkaline phosphatase family protein, partial [Dehalococcoidia bacterium]